jgi:hypothetical protein
MMVDNGTLQTIAAGVAEKKFDDVFRIRIRVFRLFPKVI